MTKTMTCRSARDRMMLFVAGELALAEAARLREHLSECPHCAAKLAALEATQEQLSNALGAPMEAPPTLDARVMATLRRLPPRRANWPAFVPPWTISRRLMPAMGMACALLLGVVVGRTFVAPDNPLNPLPPTELAQNYRLMGDHVMVEADSAASIRARLIELAPAEASRDIAPLQLDDTEVKPWGGCWMTVDGRPVPSYCFKWRGRRVSVWQAEAKRQLDDYSVAQRDGICSVEWNEGGKRFALTVEAPPEEGLRLARSVKIGI